MTGKLTFKLPQQKEQLLAAVNAANLPIAIHQIDQLFRDFQERTETDRESDFLEGIQNRINEIFKTNNLV